MARRARRVGHRRRGFGGVVSGERFPGVLTSMLRALTFLLAVGSVSGQDAALARLKQELKTAQDEDASDQKRAEERQRKTGAWPDDLEGRGSARLARVHAVLLNWIESQLPMGRS